jgi:hypothetical protein
MQSVLLLFPVREGKWRSVDSVRNPRPLTRRLKILTIPSFEAFPKFTFWKNTSKWFNSVICAYTVPSKLSSCQPNLAQGRLLRSSQPGNGCVLGFFQRYVLFVAPAKCFDTWATLKDTNSKTLQTHCVGRWGRWLAFAVLKRPCCDLLWSHFDVNTLLLLFQGVMLTLMFRILLPSTRPSCLVAH